MNKQNSEKLMDVLALEKTLSELAKANRVQWFEHTLRKNDEDLLIKH